MSDYSLGFLTGLLYLSVATAFAGLDCLWPKAWRILRHSGGYEDLIAFLCLNWWFIVLMDIHSLFEPPNPRVDAEWEGIKNEGID